MIGLPGPIHRPQGCLFRRERHTSQIDFASFGVFMGEGIHVSLLCLACVCQSHLNQIVIVPFGGEFVGKVKSFG